MSISQEKQLTHALVTRHVGLHTGGWNVAMLDIAQDHILCHLSEIGIFKKGLLFKGGTALRKCRIGSKGRFSTDLDLYSPSRELIEEVFYSIDSLECHGFRFKLKNQELSSGRADLVVYPPFKESARTTSDFLRADSKLEISTRKPWLEPDSIQIIKSPVHYALNHDLPTVPIFCLPEAVAEKLARYSRDPITRDLYDLWWYGKNTVLDEPLIRSLWVKKVYLDSVIEDRWKGRKFEPINILSTNTVEILRSEQIGLYHDDNDVIMWDKGFRQRYKFLEHLAQDDLRWAKCSARDRYDFVQLIGDN